MKNKNNIILKYNDAYSRIMQNDNLTTEEKNALIQKLIRSMTRASIHADKKVEINKKLNNIDLDKAATIEFLVGAVFPVMASVVVAWGLGTVQNRELYNKVVDVMMDEVLKISAVGAVSGLITTVFQDKLKNKLQQNFDNAVSNKLAIEESKEKIEHYANIDELNI